MVTYASVEDFILTFGELESLELSSLEDSNEIVINTNKLQNALDLSKEFILGYEAMCNNKGSIAIFRNIRYLMLNIARHTLDSLKRREDVKETYQSCIDFLDKASQLENNSSSSQEDLELYNLTDKKKISYSKGRRAFTDENLQTFRKDRFNYS